MRELFLPDSFPFAFPYRVEYSHPRAAEMCAEKLTQALSTFPSGSELVCLCIGTDRSTGDSLGPLVGMMLEKMAIPNLHIYGTLDEPVHAVNLRATLADLRRNLKNPRIIAVDACLGQLDSVGSIQIGMGPLKPGAGVNKKLPEVGEVHITGIVNVAGFMEYFVLQNTRLNIVMKMAEVISRSIQFAASRLHREAT